MSAAVIPFRVATPQADLDDLRERLARTRWPDAGPVADWSQGVPLAVVREVCDRWADGYDWRASEQRLNAYPQYRTEIDGIDVHFLHVPSAEPNALPLVVTHGWPGSVFEFLGVIDALADPVAHGGEHGDAFHVVCPSLPGYGWSGKPAEPGWDVSRTARAWAILMQRLGYQTFGAQGGDWGSRIATALGSEHADRIVGIHLTMPLASPPGDHGELSGPEQQAVAALSRFRQTESGYALLQATRPQTLGYALHDSPAGQCAWILEKFCGWSDVGDDPVRELGADRILDHVMTYWLTGSATSSARFYWESLQRSRHWQRLSGTSSSATPADLVPVPAGVSQFPGELFRPPRHWVERQYLDLRYWNQVDRGGHFPSLEQPALYIDEVRRFFRLIR